MQNVNKETKRKNYIDRLKQELTAARKQARIEKQARLEETQRRKKLEREMREVFGIPEQNKAKPISVGAAWLVKVSVRKLNNGVPFGPVFHKEFRYHTVSKLDAELRAKKALRENNLALWFIVESKAEDM